MRKQFIKIFEGDNCNEETINNFIDGNNYEIVDIVIRNSHDNKGVCKTYGYVTYLAKMSYAELIRLCEYIEENIKDGKSKVVITFNPLGPEIKGKFLSRDKEKRTIKIDINSIVWEYPYEDIETIWFH
jgi:hypothetical protein